MPIVDTHCHVSQVYYEPVEVLLFQMDRAGVDHAVLIQMREEYDNEYQFECERRYPGRFASVMLVDHNSPDAPVQLGGWPNRARRACAWGPTSARRAMILWRSGARPSGSAWR